MVYLILWSEAFGKPPVKAIIRVQARGDRGVLVSLRGSTYCNGGLEIRVSSFSSNDQRAGVALGYFIVLADDIPTPLIAYLNTLR